MTLRLATRRSPLALRQAERVRDALVARGVDCELIEVTSSGDRDEQFNKEGTTAGCANFFFFFFFSQM